MKSVRILAFVLVLCGPSTALACDCSAPVSVKEAKKHAEVVFRGTITDISEGMAHFRVERVWKGKVGRYFEMDGIPEGSACIGFWPDLLSIGNDLLVYAFRLPDKEWPYFTSICTRTRKASSASEDFRKLGRSRPPGQNE